ncbi:MAG: hypothetical protein F4Z57_05555 [Gemmatimonadetes bacterium]|nr:hypothetical protein [Gemmatimonadota bacterium]MYC73204.1 hypothetical protein [Gemmatimonadota bacterium]MYI64117.1 hypothetical protein [Gemmatimonadota bacterium]
MDAWREIQRISDFVGSPENILGSPATKHGEIAEQVHVGVRRAIDALHGRIPTATDQLGRLDPVDYRVDGVDIQSKYYNGLRNTLDGVSSHATKYQDFASGDGHYHIPRDQYQQIEQLRQTGQIDGLSEKSANAIRNKLNELQQATGRSPDELIQPGEGTYAEVQQGRVHDTLDDRENRLVQKNDELKQEAKAEHGPSLSGLGSAAAIGAGAGGGVRFGQAIWVKYRDGKNPFKGEFSTQDWKDVGVATAKGAGSGAVAGSALYALTNSTDLAAPFAGALVSSLMGVGDLLSQYHSGKIDGDQFVELSHIIAADAAIVGLTAAAGQVLIPIPMLGAFVGSLTGKIVASAIKDGLGAEESELIARLAAYEKSALEQLDKEFRAFIKKLDAYFGNLEHLAKIAFDNTVNTALRLEASIQFAEIVGVPDRHILRNTDDLDVFMME